MFGFGKRNKPPPEKAGTGGTGGVTAEREPFPWAGDGAETACNLAFGSLANSLPGWITVDGRIHAETYVAAAGGIAGYFALLTLKAENPGATLHVATTTAGERYYMGDPLNEMLLPKTEADAKSRVWSRAASAAVHAGLPMTGIPDVAAMFRHVAASVGGPHDGKPSTGPNHQPHLPVRALLKVLAPRVAQILSGDISEMHRQFGAVPPKWWCAITAYATARPIIDVKDVLDPAIALTILMESAIYGSKLVRL